MAALYRQAASLSRRCLFVGRVGAAIDDWNGQLTLAMTATRRLRYAIARRRALLGDSALSGSVLSASGLGNAALALLLLPGLALGSVANAQTILPPAPAPGGPVSGPPDGAIAPGPPIRLPAPSPTPAPTPAPVPTPVPTPAPASPAVQSPAPAGLAPPRERPRPPRPVNDRPAPATDRPAPVDVPPGAPAAPAGDTATAPLDDAAPPPAGPAGAQPAASGTLPAWWPYALAAALAALAGGWWALRRRRADPVAEVAEVAVAAAPPKTKQPTVKQIKKQKTTSPAPPQYNHQLHATLEPLSASTTLVNLRLRYALVLSNPTDSDIGITGHAETILAGSGAQEDTIRQWFDAAPLALDHGGTVPAKGELRIEREIAIPLGQLSAMQVRGRIVLIPVLLLSLSFRHATGLGQIGRAFVIGKAGQADAKLAPLQLDQGMGGFGALGARDTGIALTI